MKSILICMWAEFAITTIFAFGLMFPELRRLAGVHGVIFVASIGSVAVVAVSAWLLSLFVLGYLLTAGFKPLEFSSLLATFILPLSTFLIARRRFSVVASLLPAVVMFAVVTFVYIIIAIKLAYQMPNSDLHTILEQHHPFSENASV